MSRQARRNSQGGEGGDAAVVQCAVASAVMISGRPVPTHAYAVTAASETYISVRWGGHNRCLCVACVKAVKCTINRTEHRRAQRLM